MSAICHVDLATFCGRIGNLYGKYRMSPPFSLYHAAQGWIARDIPLSHCVEVIEDFLGRHAGNCYSGSGDWNFAWVNSLIQTTWYDRSFAKLPSSAPQRKRRQDWPEEYSAEGSSRRPGRAAAFNFGPVTVNSKPDSFELDGITPRKKVVRAFSPAKDTKSAVRQQGPKPGRNAIRFSGQTPTSGPKKIDVAVAWLRAELVSGERAAAEVESNALCAGIAPRTYDRARKRLGVTSQRIGFGRWAKYVIALPAVYGTPSEGANKVGAT
jgi:hypothetical protein